MRSIDIRSGIAAALVAAAVGARADIWSDMWERDVTLREGVTLRARRIETPRKMAAYIARIDLATPGLGFVSAERDKEWGRPVPASEDGSRIETRRETTVDFMRRSRKAGRNMVLAVNTTPWTPWPAPKGNVHADLVGWNVTDGREIAPEDPRREGAVLVVWRDGRAEIARSVPPPMRKDVAFAVSGFGIIMENGHRTHKGKLGDSDKGWTQCNPEGTHPRTAVGLTADRRTLVILVVDGRQEEYSVGADIPDLCRLFREEGVTDAINMDGGGSTSLVVYDPKKKSPKMLNHHARGKRRANGANLGICFDRPRHDADRMPSRREWHHDRTPEGHRPAEVPHGKEAHPGSAPAVPGAPGVRPPAPPAPGARPSVPASPAVPGGRPPSPVGPSGARGEHKGR